MTSNTSEYHSHSLGNGDAVTFHGDHDKVAVELASLKPNSLSTDEKSPSMPPVSTCTATCSIDSNSDSFLQYNPSDIMLAWKDLSISTLSSPRTLLSSSTGFVRRGKTLAVIGASGSGKSLFLQALCNRLSSSSSALSVSGSLLLDGRLHSLPLSSPLPIAFVPQSDILIGELTVRETLLISARLRRSAPLEALTAEVETLIAQLGLTKVADSAIGTVLKRGLSGGEKRRVSVGVELIAQAKCLLLDEATSGLDAWTAFQVIQTIRSLCYSSSGRISVVCSLHQPNARILELFDDLLLFNSGRVVYFGPVSVAVQYFANLGFMCPDKTTPTDWFMHVIDKRFGKLRNEQEEDEKDVAVASIENDNEVDFSTRYRLSPLAAKVHATVSDLIHQSHASFLLPPSPSTSSVSPPSSFSRFLVLAHRNFLLATRDITLYWLQFALCAAFGWLVGAFFFNLPRDVGSRQNDLSNGLVWISFVGTYIHTFGVYHQMEMRRRFEHERANGAVTALPWTAADLVVNLPAAFLAFVPGLLIAFFMMSQPSASAPFFLFVLAFMTWTAQSIAALACQFARTTPTASLLAQGAFVILSLYAGGAFVRWSKLGFWKWLSALSVYTWSTRAFMTSVYSHVDFHCASSLVTGNGSAAVCGYNALQYPCVGGVDAQGGCMVDGRTLLDINVGISTNESKWFNAGLVVVLFVAIRLLTFILLRSPLHTLLAKARLYLGNTTLMTTLARQNENVELLQARVLILEDALKCNVDDGKEKQQKKVMPSAIACESVAQPSALLLSSLSPRKIHPEHSSTSIPSPGHIALTIQSRQSSFRVTPSSLHWSNLSLLLKGKGTRLVSDLSGFAVGGRILAIMGPSGAGKTTLLNALSGRAPYAERVGSVQLGNRALNQTDLAYVPQFDALNPVLTVVDTFLTQARLMMMESGSVTTAVAELMAVLGLAEKRDAVVGSLTGGERKRISIGLGLLAHPNVLFLDEPTTSLDSEAALAVVSYLVRLVRRTNVICLLTLHQPSSQIWNRLDDLLLLSGGQTAFFGAAKESEEYFGKNGFIVPKNTNPADYYLDCVNRSPKTVRQEEKVGKNGEQQEQIAMKEDDRSWNDLYVKSDIAKKYQPPTPTDVKKVVRPSEFSRFHTLFFASLHYYLHELNIYPFRLLEMLIIGVFIGTVFLRRNNTLDDLTEINGALFFSVWSTLFAAISATPTFVRDRCTVENEYLNGGYKLITVQMATWMASLPFHLVTAVLYNLLVHFLVGFHDQFEAWVFSVLTTFVLLSLMETISQMVVEGFRDANLATTFGMVVLGCFFLFPGFFIKVDDMPRSIFWTSYLVPTRYALDSMLDMIFRGQDYWTGSGWMSGTDVLKNFWQEDVDHFEKWGYWAIVLLFLLGFRATYYAFTVFRYRQYAR